MTDKSNFTPDEWNLLLQSVMAAGIAYLRKAAADDAAIVAATAGAVRPE